MTDIIESLIDGTVRSETRNDFPSVLSPKLDK